MLDAKDPAACLAQWSTRGPRYTSYPPATEFQPISLDRVRRELQGLGASREPVSLYLHVPFCKSLCWYCGCNVVATRDEGRGVHYVDDLTTELTLLSNLMLEAPVREISLGGGSPNFLAPRTLRTLMAAIDRYLHVTPGARRSIELDPRQTTSSQIETLADAGFTAVSIGVQDFAEPVQDAIHRHQTEVQTRWLVERTRAAGFDDINVDIVYGLPRQTEDSFRATLDKVIALAPDRVALFGYAHLPSKLPHQRLVERAGRVLDRYERATLMLLAIERFAAAGYLHIGLDHFAKPGSRLARAAAGGRLVRTFQGYTERLADSIIGVGASAISSTPRMHWQNHADLRAWEDAVQARRLPTSRGFVLDADDRVRAALINRLMCDGRIDLERLGTDLELDAEAYFARELQRLERVPELACYDRGSHSIETTALGRILVRNVCMMFDRYHEETDELRYSATI